jgi:dihydropteroate synthase
MAQHPGYSDVVADVTRVLTDRAVEARRNGARRVWIDPGIGFAKDLDDNLNLLAALGALVASGWPVAVGTSRKSSLGVLAGRADRRAQSAASPAASDPPPGDRLEGSLATALWAAQCGVDLVRVHDVADTIAAFDAAGFGATNSFSLDDEASASSFSPKER